MREHRINCKIEGSKSLDNIQYIINKYTTLHIANALQNSGLSRESKIEVLSRLIEELKRG